LKIVGTFFSNLGGLAVEELNLPLLINRRGKGFTAGFDVDYSLVPTPVDGPTELDAGAVAGRCFGRWQQCVKILGM